MKRNLRFTAILVLLLFIINCCMFNAVFAQDTQPRRAYISAMEGSVLVQAAGQATAIPARKNMEIKTGDRIITGRDGTCEIRYDDGSISRIGPGSRILPYGQNGGPRFHPGEKCHSRRFRALL